MRRLASSFVLTAISAVFLAVSFQNCSQPYNVDVAQLDFKKLSVDTITLNNGTAYSNKVEVQLTSSLAYGSLPQIFVTETSDCGGNETWQKFDGPITIKLSGDDGQKFVYAKFKKLSGEMSQCFAASIVLDRTAPKFTLPIVPDPVTGNHVANIRIVADDASGSGVAQIQCRFDADPLADCGADVTSTNLPLGPHSFDVTVHDKAGNSASLNYGWIVDGGMPEVTVTKPVPPIVLTSAVSLSFTASDGADGQGISETDCAFDGAPVQPCTSPLTLNALSEGAHTLKIYAIDRAKRQSAAATVMWNVDLSPPTVKFNAMAMYQLNSAVTMDFTGSDLGTQVVSYQCQLDSASKVACMPGTKLTTTEGSHQIQVWATDAAGRVSAPIATSFVTDLNPPQITSLSEPDGGVFPYVGYYYASFSFLDADSASGVVERTCEVDGAAQDCTAQGDVKPGDAPGLHKYWNQYLSAGNHTFKLTVTDAAGRSTSRSVNFVDQ